VNEGSLLSLKPELPDGFYDDSAQVLPGYPPASFRKIVPFVIRPVTPHLLLELSPGGSSKDTDRLALGDALTEEPSQVHLLMEFSFVLLAVGKDVGVIILEELVLHRNLAADQGEVVFSDLDDPTADEDVSFLRQGDIRKVGEALAECVVLVAESFEFEWLDLRDEVVGVSRSGQPAIALGQVPEHPGARRIVLEHYKAFAANGSPKHTAFLVRRRSASTAYIHDAGDQASGIFQVVIIVIV